MAVATLEELLEAGVHFGHMTRGWNPKMKPYIWGERNGINIIDLTLTTRLLDEACRVAKEYAERGKKIVFVGTKKQAATIVEEEAQRCGAYFINKRWLGGTLTNFETIRTRIYKLRELEEMKTNGHFDRLPKKEVSVLTRQLEKLDRTLGGIKDMRGMPDLLFVIDQHHEGIAIEEANKKGVPVIALVDTNSDPEGVDYVIPGNDDAIRAVRLITAKIANAVIEGHELRDQRLVKAVSSGQKADDAEEMPEISAAEMKRGGKEAVNEPEPAAVEA
jgi:small subunit ribosomal protein S2